MAKQIEKDEEWINTTDSVRVWVEKDHEIPGKDPIPVMVKPGESIFFTKKEVQRNRRQKSQIFSKGLLRPVGADADQLRNIEVRNAMSDIEMREFVSRADKITTFATKLRKVDSVNTLENIRKHVEDQNKTFNFYKSVTKRIELLTKKQEDLIMKDPEDKEDDSYLQVDQEHEVYN